MNREAIYSALFALVSASGAFATASRRLKMWADVPSAEQPAIFQCQKSESTAWETGVLPKRTLFVDLFIYAYSGDDGISPSTLLNPLIDAVEAAIVPPNGQAQRLGGLVDKCRITGRTEIFEGLLGNQAVAIIPVEILGP